MSQLVEDVSKMDLTEPKRRPYFGSCHCGFIRYVCWLTFPVTVPYAPVSKIERPVQLIRKCNCIACHKLGFFHVRLANSAKDFALLSPLDPLSELSDYMTTNLGSHWLFCKTCGVRCFLLEGEGEVVERDLAAEGVDLARAKIESDGKKVEVWAPKVEGWAEEDKHWFRVNAQTLDPRQAGLDLREWHDKQWIQYVNMLDEIPGAQYDKPYEGGTY